MQYFVPCKNCLFIACKLSKYNISWSEGGGLSGQYDVHKGGGGDGKVDEYGQGEGGGQKYRKFCGRHMYMAPYL